MMKKKTSSAANTVQYRSREKPPKGANTSYLHPGFWSDHIKHVDIRKRQWYSKYGHIYYEDKGCSIHGSACRIHGCEYQDPGHSVQVPSDDRNLCHCAHVHSHGIPEGYDIRPLDQVPQSEPVAYLRAKVKQEIEKKNMEDKASSSRVPPSSNAFMTGDHKSSMVQGQDRKFSMYGHIYYEDKGCPIHGSACRIHGCEYQDPGHSGQVPSDDRNLCHCAHVHGIPEGYDIRPLDQVPQSEPVAYLRAKVKQEIEKKNMEDKASSSRVPPPSNAFMSGDHKSSMVQGQERKSSMKLERYPQQMPHKQVQYNMDCVYPTPGNTQPHHVVNDPKTTYSKSYGHHSRRFCTNPELNSSHDSPYIVQPSKADPEYTYMPSANHDFKHPTSADDKSLPILQKSGCSYQDSTQSHDHQRNSYQGSSNLNLQPLSTTAGRSVPLSKPTGPPFEERYYNQGSPDSACISERCPYCLKEICQCVPRRRQRVPEDERNRPEQDMPAWLPQSWLGKQYHGNRTYTEADILQHRYRLSRDIDQSTPMNRMYDEYKEKERYKKQQNIHTGKTSLLCSLCRDAYKLEEGTKFQEMIRKDFPYTTGDVQCLRCALNTTK